MEIEATSREKLNLLQEYFIEMCKDDSLDVAIRLNLLVCKL